MSTRKDSVHRVQFDVLADRLREYDKLMADGGISTRKDLFDNALSLFEWAMNEVKNGRVIASYDKNQKDLAIVRMPVLDRASRQEQQSTVRAIA